jgi:CubicO group peptidase (beta-lactamase class C family)
VIGVPYIQRRVEFGAEAAAGERIEATGEVFSAVPLRFTTPAGLTDLGEGRTRWRYADRVGCGMSEVLRQLGRVDPGSSGRRAASVLYSVFPLQREVPPREPSRGRRRGVMARSSASDSRRGGFEAGDGRLDGWLHPDFMPVAKALRTQLRRYAGGAAVCVYHRGECVVDLWGGARNRAGAPWRRDTMAPSFSTTKGVASTLVHIMVDRGLLDYDALVSDYWPEFAQAGKEAITLRQVMAHQSGLYHIRQMIDHADRMLDWEHMVMAIERAEPIHPPGERTGYHGLTYGFLVGEVLQRVTGRSFSQLVEEELASPLDLDGFYVGAPDEVLDRAAELMWPRAADRLRSMPAGPTARWLGTFAETSNDWIRGALGSLGMDFDLASLVDALAPRGISGFEFDSGDTLRAAIPAGNGLFTARSLARMYAALAGGGELDGVQLISSETLARATERQGRTPGKAVLPFDMRWRLGYHGVATTRGSPYHAFGHFGFGGSGAWADPTRELAVSLIVNCGMGTPFGDTRTARISGAALASALAREPLRRGAAATRRRRGSREPLAQRS